MSGEQVNVEYIFRLLYEWIYGSHASVNYAALKTAIVQLWIWISYVGYILSIAGFFIIVYALVKLFELRKEEHTRYTTLAAPKETAGAGSSRWQHIESLMTGTSPSQWREAIIEADIMLDDLLAEAGYAGDGVGEKLKTISKAELGAINDAWEAHKVRNQIAHEGSAFDLSESLARRTIARYETVFREFHVI